MERDIEQPTMQEPERTEVNAIDQSACENVEEVEYWIDCILDRTRWSVRLSLYHLVKWSL